MANKLISEMGLPRSIANDALSLTEFELMELLDVNLKEVTSAVAHISEIACPPHQTALSLLEQRIQVEYLAGHLPTRLEGLDVALCGGIPFGVLTELVGPAGIGKTQFCLKLSLLASLPSSYGGLNGRVIYIDVESKFSSRRYLRNALTIYVISKLCDLDQLELDMQNFENVESTLLRMIEIGVNSFPEVFYMEGMAQEMAGRILVLRPASLSEFTESLQQIKVSILQKQVKLLVVDGMAALVTG
ncbi:hypothetical protein RJ640_012378 [Escallonia rubra]|uniref:RecA family profile 1 domain-containing protein n=1 Tax=Escallonia rubra TaxID=112253 RepID=A0AA88QSS8_9ASTE|nr:hypothetical protein RJ640_012378 [Escallonia rubra]